MKDSVRESKIQQVLSMTGRRNGKKRCDPRVFQLASRAGNAEEDSSVVLKSLCTVENLREGLCSSAGLERNRRGIGVEA